MIISSILLILGLLNQVSGNLRMVSLLRVVADSIQYYITFFHNCELFLQFSLMESIILQFSNHV